MAQYEVMAPITINGLATDMETAKKGLDKIAMRTATTVRDYIPMLYKSATFQQLTKKSKVYSGLTEATDWDLESIMEPEGMEFLYDVTATHYGYKKATSYTYKAQLFDEYNVFPKLAKQLGLSLGHKRQKLGASLFNNGFTTNFADGVPFFSAAHPNDLRIGGTQSNLVAGGLSVSTLTDAINLLMDMRDPLGRPLNYMPKRLWVHPTKAIFARQILGVNGMEYGTANNNKNPFSDFKLEVMEYPWFTTSTQWMLQADDYETYVSAKVGFKTKMEQQDDYSIRHEGHFVDAYWAESWMGFVSSTGL